MRLGSQHPLALLVLTMLFTPTVLGLERFPAKIETLPGLSVATFNTPQGKIIVYLPDDMDTGDVISGTVVIEPAGKTKEEQQRNKDELNGYWVELENNKLPVIQKNLRWNIPDVLTDWVSHLILRDRNGKEVARTIVSVEDIAPTIERNITPSSWEYQLPIVGHAGNPIQIKGPFDGNLDTTELKIGGKEVKILAESPRKLIFESPIDILGPTQIELREGSITIKRNFTNLRVVKISKETQSTTKQPITKVETKEEETKKERLAKQIPLPIKQPETEGFLKEEELLLSSPHTEEHKKVEEQKEKLVLATPKPQPLPPLQPKVEIETGKVNKKEKLLAKIPPPIEGKYTVQVASFKKESVAQEFAEELELKGYPVFIRQAKIPGRGIWYRVRVGTFKTIRDAILYGNDLKKQEKGMESLFVTVNN